MSKQQPEVWKERLLVAMEQSLGIVTAACKQVGICRERFYEYYNTDPIFKKKIDDLDNVTLDFVENQLLKKIQEGSERSIVFYMKHKGKRRGYVSSTDITTNGESIQTIIQIIDPTKNDDKV